MFFENLTCEYLRSPIGVQEKHPRLSWEMRRGAPDEFEVAVFQSPDGISGVEGGRFQEIWRCRAGRETGFVYADISAVSRQKIFWRIESSGRIPLSEFASFEFGLFEPSDWVGEWIAGGKNFRREFELETLPAPGARLYICGLGIWYGTLNGRELSDRRMSPAQTDYRERVFYHVIDLDGFLREGKNVLNIQLGEGFFAQSKVCGREAWSVAPYGSERLLYQLEFSLPDGRDRKIISSGTEDMVFSTPVVDDNPYSGEIYNAGIEPEFLRFAHICTPPGGKLEADPLPHCRILRRITPQRMFFNGNKAIYDFGENFTGVAEITLHGQPRGAEIVLRMAEELTADQLELDNSTQGIFATKYDQIDRYICRGNTADGVKGGNTEIYAPAFTYRCFRYLELSGWENGRRPDLADAAGLVIANDIINTSYFRSSDPDLEVFFEMAKRTLLDNCLGVPTDCPIREKCGWLGDAQVEAEFGIYAFEMGAFWNKYIFDIYTNSGDGIPHCIAPGMRRCEEAYPLWGAAIVLLPYYQYLYYGDDRPGRRCWKLMERWMDYLESLEEDGIVYRGLGDWCPPGFVHPVKTPVELTSTAIYYHCADKMVYLAERFGMAEAAERFRQKREFLRDKFTGRFFQNGSFGSQAADALALEYGLCPEGKTAEVSAALRREVEAENFHHDCGIVGWKMLFSSLSRGGDVETAWKVLKQTTYPSLKDAINRGATTMWETFETPEQEKRSHCHPMQSGFARFFPRDLGGINPMEEFPGFEKVSIRPVFPAELDAVDCVFHSCRGDIGVKWERKNGEIEFELILPGGVGCGEKIFPPGEKVNFHLKNA